MCGRTSEIQISDTVVLWLALLHSFIQQSLNLGFCTGSNPACGMSEIQDGEDLWQWSQLEIRLNAFCQSTIPQKQFIIIIYIFHDATYCCFKLALGKETFHKKEETSVIFVFMTIILSKTVKYHWLVFFTCTDFLFPKSWCSKSIC